MDDIFSSTQLMALLLQPVINDSLEDYQKSLTNKAFLYWDAIIITASNKSQACGYEKQIEYRKSQGLIPAFTDIIIIPDSGAA